MVEMVEMGWLDWEEVSKGSESGEWEAQAPEEAEYSEALVVRARKAKVVWVEEPRSSTQEYRANLARLAARLPGYWASSGATAGAE
jgi:hypothetical protein